MGDDLPELWKEVYSDEAFKKMYDTIYNTAMLDAIISIERTYDIVSDLPELKMTIPVFTNRIIKSLRELEK